MEKNYQEKTEFATVGAGCYWCIDAMFRQVPGVKSTVSGFTAEPDKAEVV